MQAMVGGGFGDTQKQGLPTVRFRMHPVENPEKSWGRKDSGGNIIEPGEGRPIYDEVEFIRIQMPGDKNDIIDRPVTEFDKQRFAREYQGWKAGAKQADSGTPLESWPSITRGQVEELAYFGVKTVEQLAGMADAHAHKFMAFNSLRQKARDFIEAAKGNSISTSLRVENDELRNKMATLESAMKEQAKLLEEIRKRK
jgi:hypothetical protein